MENTILVKSIAKCRDDESKAGSDTYVSLEELHSPTLTSMAGLLAHYNT